MTMNVMETARKMMGWCPNASDLAAKRVMIALPEGEDFFTDEKGKGSVNMSEIIISFIIAVIVSAYEWRRYNHINEGKYRDWNPGRKKILVGIMIWILFLGVMRQVYFLRIDLPFEILLIVMMATGFIYSIINYPMVIYWEWKNKKTIYLVEKESRGWRPVALPDRVS